MNETLFETFAYGSGDFPFDPICSRKLSLINTLGGDFDVMISMGAPGFKGLRDTFCRFSIVGGPIDAKFEAPGAFDGFNAIKVALRSIQRKLEALGGAPCYLNQENWSGFPRFVEDGFGMEFYRQCEKALIAEEEQFYGKLEAKWRDREDTEGQ